MIPHVKHWLEEQIEARRAKRITPDDARRRVSRGAKYLDDVAPGWEQLIDPWQLDLAHGNTCVLGQLHGSFALGLGRAGLFSLGSAPRASFSPVDLGFHCVQGVCEALQEQDYEYLNQAWHEEIEKRGVRGAAAALEHPPHSGDGAAVDVDDILLSRRADT